MTTKPNYDAVLLVSFGGPEAPEEVMPFLRTVVAGKGISDERLAAVAAHYHALGGRSPINDHCRRFLALVEQALQSAGVPLRLYWGNRNSDPTLRDTVAQMARDGVGSALAFITSAFSSYSGCRQYLEDIERACQQVGPGAPHIERLRSFHDHPEFIGAITDAVAETIASVPEARLPTTALLFSAHSIPMSMAKGCDYSAQLQQACAWVVEALPQGRRLPHRVIYQSRSGPPHVPWLGPDVLDALAQLAEAGTTDVVLSPIGFLSDHMEVVWDLDHEAKQRAGQLGMQLHRVPTPLFADRFVAMVVELICERVRHATPRFLGAAGPRPVPCAPDCCRYSPRKPSPGQ